MALIQTGKDIVIARFDDVFRPGGELEPSLEVLHSSMFFEQGG